MVKVKVKQKWPADKVSRRAITELVPYSGNARTHSPEQIDQISASMGQWGWTNPVLIDEVGMIIAGHGRVLAAQKLGYTTVPVMVAEGWSEYEKCAYVIADNKLAENADWDLEILSNELADLDLDGFDLSLIGFDDDELADLLNDPTEGETDPDDVPGTPEKPVSVLGDVWIPGDHRLICGDSTSADDVAKVLSGVKPHLMVTDPPYGVEYDASFRNRIKRQNGTVVKARAVGKVLNDDRADWSEAYALFPGDVAYVWHAGIHADTVSKDLKYNEFNIRSQIIWAKNQFAIGRGDYHWQHEPCWYAVRKNKVGHYAGGRKQSTLWQIPKPQKSETGHSTQKPVECMKRPIENNSSPGQAIYEPFSGSGTTIIAAEMTGRKCYAIELNPAYVDVSVKRWQEFTGKEAVLEETGETFSEIENSRAEAA